MPLWGALIGLKIKNRSNAAHFGKMGSMLYMIIEQFPKGDPSEVGKRFRKQGRLLPDGVEYRSSWIEPSGASCFQLMWAESRILLDQWLDRWSDLVEFTVVPVVDSKAFWENRRG